MKKRRKVQGCAYCGIACICEIEHVFPESWYPDGHTPSQMLTVPGCAECNRGLGKIEERLFLLFAATMPDSDVRLASIRERAQRAISPSTARVDEDPRYPDGAKETARWPVFESLRNANDPQLRMWNPLPRVRQSLVTPAGLHVDGFHAIEFPMTDLACAWFVEVVAAMDMPPRRLRQDAGFSLPDLHPDVQSQSRRAVRGVRPRAHNHSTRKLPIRCTLQDTEGGASATWVFSHMGPARRPLGAEWPRRAGSRQSDIASQVWPATGATVVARCSTSGAVNMRGNAHAWSSLP